MEPRADAFDELVERCIESYGELYNDTYALDYNRVTGKMRAMVLESRRYRTETRALRARQMLAALKEADEINALAKPAYDIRGDNSIDKDAITMRLKSAAMKQELLSQIMKDEGGEESDAVNIFVVPITREEFESLPSAEIEDGDAESESEAFDSLRKQEEIPQGANLRTRKANAAEKEPEYEIVNGEITG
jgi:hypothetical protein